MQSQNKLHQKPRNKRNDGTKFPQIDTSHSSSILSKSKPDPSAPKITRPCIECGKRLWSWKALFDHMRCHPERRWRGNNPLPSFYHLGQGQEEEDHELANYLLMLANNDPFNNNNNNINISLSDNQSRPITTVHQEVPDPYSDPDMPNIVVDHSVGSSGWIKLFECSSCKKVFGSHQALDEHRANHENVKYCYAITMKNIDGDVEDEYRLLCIEGEGCDFDLNKPLVHEDVVTNNSSSNNPLDLRLGL